MVDGTDVAAVNLWSDVDGDFAVSIGDVLLATGTWAVATMSWDFTGLNIASGENLVISINVAAGATVGAP